MAPQTLSELGVIWLILSGAILFPIFFCHLHSDTTAAYVKLAVLFLLRFRIKQWVLQRYLSPHIYSLQIDLNEYLRIIILRYYTKNIFCKCNYTLFYTESILRIFIGNFSFVVVVATNGNIARMVLPQFICTSNYTMSPKILYL